MKALGISAQNHLSKFVSLQAHYTIATRDLEREIVPLLLDQKIGLMVWSPLSGGFLSGKYDRNMKAEEGRRTDYDFHLSIRKGFPYYRCLALDCSC